MKPIVLPKIPDTVSIGICDECELNDSDLEQGSGIYYREICYKCRTRSAHMG